MNKYVIPIPNEKAPAYRLVTFIIFLLNFFAFGFVFLHTDDIKSNIAAVTGLIVNVIPFIFFLLNKRHLKTPFTEISFFISALIWLLWANYLLSLLMIVFSLFSFFANKKPEIIFDEEGISYPSFPVKKYTWQEVSQVIWKDGILTIDLKNNKLLQFAIDKSFTVDFDDIHFNKWCSGNTGLRTAKT